MAGDPRVSARPRPPSRLTRSAARRPVGPAHTVSSLDHTAQTDFQPAAAMQQLPCRGPSAADGLYSILVLFAAIAG